MILRLKPRGFISPEVSTFYSGISSFYCNGIPLKDCPKQRSHQIQGQTLQVVKGDVFLDLGGCGEFCFSFSVWFS